MNNVFGLLISAFIGLVAITIGFGSWYTVDQGYRGVIVRNGAVVGMAEPGLGFKAPIIDSVIDISVQEHVRTFGTESGGGLASYSFDQQPADIRLSVNWRIPPEQVTVVYADFGGEDGIVTRILDPRVYQTVKNIFGRFNAVTAIQDRARLNHEILAALQESVVGLPLTVNGVQIENIDFSDAYEASIEQRMQAEVEVQKLRQNAEREKVQAQITVTQATAIADATRTRAQADADSLKLQAEAESAAIRMRGDAEASAIKAKAEALKDNAGLISLVQVERWNGQLPTTMVPNGAIPFMNVAPR